MGIFKNMAIDEINLAADNKEQTLFSSIALKNDANFRSFLIVSIDDNNYEHHEDANIDYCWHFTKEQLIEIDGQLVETNESCYGIDSDDNYCSYIKL